MNFFLIRLMVWFVTLVVFPVPVTLLARSFAVEVLERITLNAPAARECLEPSCVDDDLAELSLSERTLARLEKAENKETDPWLRDDRRIAWITVLWSQKGVPDWNWRRDSTPYVAATYQVLGCHPDHVWPRLIAQRKAKLGPCYDGILGVDLPPRKPVRSVKTKVVLRKGMAA